MAEPACIFKHPVQPGGLAGGWMVPSKSEPTPLRAPDVDAARWRRIGRHIPLSEVRKVALAGLPSHSYVHYLTSTAAQHQG